MITSLEIRGIKMNARNHKSKENEEPKDILEQIRILLGQ